jgi:clan AA aspartic protease
VCQDWLSRGSPIWAKAEDFTPMIAGRVSSSLDATLQLCVQSPTKEELSIEAVVDTGFNGYLTLPSTLAERLKLPWLYRQQGELADGNLIVFDVHGGSVIWDEQPCEVEIEIAETGPLIGMALLAKHRLIVEVVDGGEVTIEKLMR